MFGFLLCLKLLFFLTKIQFNIFIIKDIMRSNFCDNSVNIGRNCVSMVLCRWVTLKVIIFYYSRRYYSRRYYSYKSICYFQLINLICLYQYPYSEVLSLIEAKDDPIGVQNKIFKKEYMNTIFY